MKFDLEYLDLIIKEEIQNVLSEQVSAPEYKKEMYFKSNPGLKEKWTKAYSDPNWKARADKEDTAALEFNKNNLGAIRSGRTKARMTSVQRLGNEALNDWYKSTSPEDRAMKTVSGKASARAKFYKKMEKKAKGKDASLDVSKLDSDDVYSADTGTWDDPFGLSGQTQYKFQKDIVGKPGTRIDPEKLKDRSGDFEGYHAGDLGISPETAGTIEDIGTTLLPTNIAEVPFSIVPFAKGGTVAFKVAVEQAAKHQVRKQAKKLVSQGMSKKAAKELAKKQVAKGLTKKMKNAVVKKGINPASKSLVKSKPKFLSKRGFAAQMKSPTFKKMMDGLKNVKGFKPDKAFSSARAMAGVPFLTKKVGYASQLALIAYKGCGKDRDCNDAAFKVIKDIDPEFAAAVGGEGGVGKLQKDAIKNEKASRAKFEKTENAIKNSKPGDIIKNYKRMFDDVGFEEGETVDRTELKNYFSVYAKKYGRAKVGEYQQFLDYLKQKGIKVKDQTIREHIIESVMKKLGLLT
jgi:hypothetical protein